MIHYKTDVIRDGIDVKITVTGTLVHGTRARHDPMQGIYEPAEPDRIEEMEAVDSNGEAVDLTDEESERIEIAMLERYIEGRDYL